MSGRRPSRAASEKKNAARRSAGRRRAGAVRGCLCSRLHLRPDGEYPALVAGNIWIVEQWEQAGSRQVHHGSGAGQRIDCVNRIGNSSVVSRIEEFEDIANNSGVSARFGLLWRRPRATRQSIEGGRINLGNNHFGGFDRVEWPNRYIGALRVSDPVQQSHSGEAARTYLMPGKSIDRFGPKATRLCRHFCSTQLPTVKHIALVMIGVRPELDERTKWTLLRLPNRAGVQERHIVAKIIDESPKLARALQSAETNWQRFKIAIPRQRKGEIETDKGSLVGLVGNEIEHTLARPMRSAADEPAASASRPYWLRRLECLLDILQPHPTNRCR